MRNYAPYRHIFCTFVEVKSKYNVEFKNDFMATYRFNTKLIKKFVDAQKERIAEVAKNIAPTVYNIEVTTEDREITDSLAALNTVFKLTKKTITNREYVTFGNELSSKLIKLNKGSIAIISYICNNIKWCSNKITFTESDITNYAHIDSKTFYIALNELYNEQVIINTTKKSTYVVNHNYIFRGSMTDFIKIYHDKYDGMIGFLDDKKRIILDD